ncbi:unnamed protein product [Blepharisma stoltei]|uniref:Protein kinase domain-containing protein n=1 Tax=Blepharisma stoltei TaxID=1481888 RepID=A0AAU9IT70_9CILI|nr:unnamed protein product [Blepharisma stoltei]
MANQTENQCFQADTKFDTPLAKPFITFPPEASTEINQKSIKIPQNSYYQKWRLSDKVFDGRFSSGCSTPMTPRTPATNLDRLLREIQMPSIKSEHKNFEDRHFMNKEKSWFNMPEAPISQQNSVEELEVCRYNHDFIQESLLGSGNFGSVYKCLNKLDGLHYAVKQIKTNYRHQNMRNTALQEAYALATSSTYGDNTNIIRYHSVWIEHDFLYISMELCECSLSQYIQKNPPSENTIRKIMRDICKGLKKIHANNIVHMDIKADNIFYSFSGKFKLGDLGLARITTNLTGEIPEGDARYLASEVLMHHEEDSEHIPDLTKSDIFSLGATIYEIMRGKQLPMNGKEWHDIRNGELKFVNDFSWELKEAIRKMMNKSPEIRPSAEELLATFLVSDKDREIKRLENYTKVLKRQIEELKHCEGNKKRKLSLWEVSN